MYYLWINEVQSGPYTLQQVQSMWSAGQITALTLYWQEGNAEWKPLGNTLSKSETAPLPDLISKTAAIPQPDKASPRAPATELISKTVAIPELQSDIYKANKQTALAAAQAPAPPVGSRAEENFWTGHPTLWKWASLIILGFLLVAALIGASIYNQFLIGIPVALLPLVLIFLYIYLVRNSIRYTITNKRVGLETGIFTKISRELRIQDIRSINAKINFLGYGNIEFSSAASDDAEVIFLAVSNAAAVRDLVKKLQP